MNRLWASPLFKLCIAVLLLAATPLQAQSLLTIEEVVNTVLNNNLAIQVARNNQKIAAKNSHTVHTDFFPVLGLTSSARRQIWPQEQANNALAAGLSIHWNMGLHSIFACQKLRTQSQISQLQAQQTIVDKVAEAIKSYYALVFAQQKKQVLESNLAVAKKILHLAQAKYEVGESTQLDCLAAQVKYNEEETALLLQEEAITTAKLTLCGLLGRDASEALTTVEEIPLPEQLSWETLVVACSAVNPSLLAAQKRCEEAKASLRETKSLLLPQLGFSVDYTRDGKFQDATWEAKPGAWRGSIALTWNLASVFRYPIAIQHARIQVDNGKLGIADTQRQLEAKLKQQFLQYTQQLRRYELAQQHVQVSQASAAVALEQYRLGSITLLALEQTQNAARATSLRCLEAIYNAKVAEITLQQLGGGLLDSYKL